MQESRTYLDRLLDTAFASYSPPENPSSLYDPIRYTLDLGGKRLRPRLLLLSTGLCGGEPEKALPVALGLEMLHNFTLIHDDIMDHAETRRGKTAVHVKWDNATAILSGDVMFVLAMKQISRYRQEESDAAQIRLQLMDLLLDTIQTVCDGQALDMEYEQRKSVSTEEYLEMIGAKTAALMRCALEMGAVIAGADKQTRQHCAELGEHAGLAFQIQDDLLDAVGDTARFGKKVGGDIVEGKKTYLSILAMERADEADRAILGQILGNRQAGESEILRVIRLYHDLGVIDKAVKEVSRHYNNALDKLAYFEDSEYQREIKQLLDKLRVRDN